MKKILLSLFLSGLTSISMASEEALWLRSSAISPDGSTIAFIYEGNLFTVPAIGGRATALTTGNAYTENPVWSPDGKTIAFSSNRFGSFDVFTIPAVGGSARRLTTFSKSEIVEAFLDNAHVLYREHCQVAPQSGYFPTGFSEIYKVDTAGHRPVLFSALPMQSLSVRDGKLLYQDMKGYENTWRKHHRSPVTRDIWLMKGIGETPSYVRQTTFDGEDRNPVWAVNGSDFYYLSERSGSMNVFKHTASGDVQLSQFQKNPVRYLSASSTGELCFSFNGALYTMREGEQPKKLDIQIVIDDTKRENFARNLTSGSGDFAVAKSEKELVFIAAGDVFATSVDYATTQSITNTPEEERDVDISPDGRTVVYASERNGVWGIYTSTLTRKEDKLFTYAHDWKEEPLVVGKENCFQPKFSPDGKEVAFLANRTELRVINLASKAVRTVLPASVNYSYMDGDQWFQWSPDGRWFLVPYMANGGWNNADVAVVSADGKQTVDLTQSGYSDGSASWALGGKAVLYHSDRNGYRSHGSWGAQDDIYLMFLDGAAYDQFRMTKEERGLYNDQQLALQQSSKSGAKTDKSKKKSADSLLIAPLKFDFEHCRDRIVRLTSYSSSIGYACFSKDGRSLYYVDTNEGNSDLWVKNLDDKSTKVLLKDCGSGSFALSKDSTKLYQSNGQLRSIDLADGKVKDIPFNGLQEYKPVAERSYIFDHVTNLIRAKFYDPDIHHVDWTGYAANYKQFLPHIQNDYDFAELLSELLGELNASHTGAVHRDPEASQPVAALGAYFDESYDGDGLKVSEVIAQGPLDKSELRIKAGCIITKIDGKSIAKQQDYYPLLAGKIGKRVTLTVTDEKGNGAFEQEVKPISYSDQDALLYKRWVKRRRELTDKFSGGKIGYVHIEGMDSKSFRETYSQILGEYRTKAAILVDTRHNGGGWLHNDLAVFLSGKLYQNYVAHGQYIGSDPFTSWTKPSAVLICEDNYSNANGFPCVYRALNIGKLIGAPMAGTMTAVWWENQVDKSITVGCPQVGTKGLDGNFIENHNLIPDVEIIPTPEQMLSDDDVQLKAAVELLLQQVASK